MKPGSFFALLAGIAIGATIGVLYAPAKGEESRAKVKKAVTDGIGILNCDEEDELTQEPEENE